MTPRTGINMDIKAINQIARALIALTLLLLVSPARAADAVPEGPLPVKQIGPGVYAFEGAVALMNSGNEGAIANVGFIVGETAVATSKATYHASPKAACSKTPLAAAVRKVSGDGAIESGVRWCSATW